MAADDMPVVEEAIGFLGRSRVFRDIHILAGNQFTVDRAVVASRVRRKMRLLSHRTQYPTRYVAT